MKIKALLAGLALCVATSAFAADKPTLKDGVDAGVKAAIESAMEANKAAKAAKAEWLWAKPVRKMWGKGKKTSSKVLQDAINLANEGKNDEAKALAAYIENAAKQGVMQAEKMKKAGPAQYGM
ncbi:MAG: hypothetical protein ACPGSM_08730 [Thiolinea sp.]